MFKNLVKKIRENGEIIFVSGVSVVYIAATIVVYQMAVKQSAEQQAELNEAINNGFTILPNADGSYWVIKK